LDTPVCADTTKDFATLLRALDANKVQQKKAAKVADSRFVLFQIRRTYR
jgi:hypothetical protein